jgi:regulator of sigma E protease
MNFALAIVIFILIFTFMGVPSTQPVLGAVSPDSPAEAAGLLPGDRVLYVGEDAIASWTDMQQAVAKYPGREVIFVVDRGGAEQSLAVTPRLDETLNRALVGVQASYEKFNILHAVFLGVRETIWFTAEIVLVIVRMITGAVPAEGAGPIGIVVMVGEVARTGLVNLLSFAAVISIQLGLFNLLPIPALDGSKLAFLSLEAIRGKPVDPEWENMIHLLGFALLMGFLVLITFKDLQRLNIF